MPNDELNHAIQLIQQGQPEQAQPILQALIQANQQDLIAWSWYVKSIRSPEKRLKALELCLKFNPGNPQIIDALEKTRSKLAASQPQVAAYAQADPYGALAAATPTAASIEAADAPRQYAGLDESRGRPFIWYEVWLKTLLEPNVAAYTALLQDPLANPWRAYWWIIMAGLITGLVSLFNPSLKPALDEIEKTQGAENISTIIAIGMVVLIPVGAILSVLWLMLAAAIYNLIAKSFGGTGNFSRTVYLLGAYTAPFSIVTGIISIIPWVSCLAILLWFYSFKLSATVIQAAHRLNGSRAFLVVLFPTIALIVLFCLIGFGLGSTIARLIPLPTPVGP